MRVDALSAESLPGLLALFEASSSNCFCRYWHFGGNKNEWLDRLAHRPEENAAELTGAVGSEQGRGLLAFDDAGAVIGWMKLTRRAEVPKLRGLSVYRTLDLGDEEATFSIGCFLIHPEARGRGVARALVAAAPAFVRAWGGRAVEAYPRRSPAPLYPEEAWQGPESLFSDFDVVHDVAPYPVYRKEV